MIEQFDLIIIGAGPGGYVAAIRAAQFGLKVACVEKWTDVQGDSVLGGTCLNVGCIPSKAMLESSYKYHEANESFAKHGIEIDHIGLDIKKMVLRKDQVVKKLTSGVSQLFKSNGVVTVKGTGKLLADNKVQVTGADKLVRILAAQNIILAPGSKPIDIPSASLQDDLILDNEGALALTETPKRLGVIGAGVIGLEIGSIWNRLGSEVTILEAMPDMLTIADQDVSKESARIFKKQNLQIKLGSKVTKTEVLDNKEIRVCFENADGIQEMIFDKLIVAVGRSPNTKKILGDNTGVTLDERGFITVDKNCYTGVDGIYAIGDATRGPMLAHKASEEGIMVVDRIRGEKAEINYNVIPNIIYTHPEIAWVGKTQQELEAQGKDIKVGKFPIAASGRALAAGDTDGFIKMIADKKTDRILGVHMIGGGVSELIAQAAISMELAATTEDLQLIVFAHPTVGEAFHEAALAVDGNAIHIVNRKQRIN